jgi:hypothetical protein
VIIPGGDDASGQGQPDRGKELVAGSGFHHSSFVEHKTASRIGVDPGVNEFLSCVRSTGG